jgi:glycolate oxidase
MGDGGAATSAQAAMEFNVPIVVGSGSAPGLEGTAQAAPEALRVFQLYVRGDLAYIDDQVRRAIDNGYAAFCFTVDTAHYSRRERDIDKRYVRSTRADLTGYDYQAGMSWSTIDHVKNTLGIPLMLKGIATAEDAALAVEHGVDWVWVSNHGGRQLDHGRGSIEVLPEIVAEVKGRSKIIFDGGVNRGSDVLKAIAAGAEAVSIGRMQCFGLAANGKAGIVRVLELLEDEVKRGLGLLGVTSLDMLNASYLHAAQPTTQPHALSAFPLLRL